MHTSEYDYLFKLLLIGDSGVGKVSPNLSAGIHRDLLRTPQDLHAHDVRYLMSLVVLAAPFCR